MIFVLVSMTLLLALSAFFSGSETALFSLSRYQRRRMEESPSRLSHMALALLRKPRDLLVTVLLGNMAVNILFFSLSVGVARELAEGDPRWQPAVGVAALLAVILLGEITPKTLAVNAPRQVALLAATPLTLFAIATTPFRWAAKHFVEALMGPLLRRIPKERFVTAEELRSLMEMSERGGVIDRGEHDLLREVIGFGEIRCKEVMVPRVDLVAVEERVGREAIIELARARKVQHVLVYRGDIDQVYGALSVKDVFLCTGVELRTLVRRLPIIPESKTIESLLRHFRARKVAAAIVVDEYGGTEGVVTLERILEEIVGDIDDEFDRDAPPVSRVAEDRYRVDGRLSFREWSELFGMELEGEAPGASTLGGYVMARLGRLPAEGERLEVGPLVFTVDRVRRRRIDRLLVELRRPAAAPGEAPAP